MKNIVEQSRCTGCELCRNICPKGAIQMQKNTEGFLYPHINEVMCIECKQCVKTCPILKPKQTLVIEPQAIISRSKDLTVVKNAASGGFIQELCHYIIKEGGVVCGVGYNEQLEVIHKLANTLEELQEFSGSKYAQSRIGTVYLDCKNMLLADKVVLFIGTPCQVAALKSYLQVEYEKLYTVDFVCHGVPSPGIWEQYKQMLEQKYHTEIRSCNFRDKKYGYRSTCMRVNFINGKTYYASPRTDYMLKAFYKNAINRPSCGACEFKTVQRVSDFTCYDSWQAEKISSQCTNDNQGYTNVLLQSEKARALLPYLENYIDSVEVALQKIYPKNGGMLTNSAKPYVKREEFWQELSRSSYKSAIQTYLRVSKKDIAIEKSKSLLMKLGILAILSSIRVEIKKIRR